MSENPTCSSRDARRRTVGEVVTVWIRSFRFVRGTADYIVAIMVSPTHSNIELGVWCFGTLFALRQGKGFDRATWISSNNKVQRTKNQVLR